MRTASRRHNSARRPASRAGRSPLELELHALQQQAVEAAASLGHRLGAWARHKFHPSRASCLCTRCGRELTIDVRPGTGQGLNGEVFQVVCSAPTGE